MPGATRAGVDSAGGLITAAGQSLVDIDGAPWAVIGAPVASHGESPHDAATMITGSLLVDINGAQVVRAGDSALCGHVATGADWVTSE